MSGAATWTAVALLGGLGALARVLITDLLVPRTWQHPERATIAVNVSGAFVLGLLFGLGARHELYLLAGVALLGSYTTFSAWQLATRQLMDIGDRRGAAVNVLLTLVAGIGAAALGVALG